MQIFNDERLGVDCGIDEVGRGPWAGPVVAAAVILPHNFITTSLDDSKKLSKKKREMLFEELISRSDFGIGYGSVEEIDEHNVLQATLLAMTRALANLKSLPQRALIDGNCVPIGLPCISKNIIRGDAKVASIAAASIIAKVTRDKLMTELAQLYPGYGWERNFGYGVKEHQKALKLLGVTPYHRRSFKPIHNMLC